MWLGSRLVLSSINLARDDYDGDDDGKFDAPGSKEHCM